MPGIIALHAYVGKLAQAMANSFYDAEDTPPVVENLSESMEHFSVTCNGGSKLFDVSSDNGENVKVEFYHPSKQTETISTNILHVATRIVQFLEKKYICGLKVPSFGECDSKQPFTCIPLDTIIHDFKWDATKNTEKIIERLQRINEGIDQKITHASEQIKKLNIAKSKILEVTTESGKLIALLRELDEKLSAIKAKSPPDVE